MSKDDANSSWLQRVEELIRVLDGSTIGELELSESDTEIIIRRQPGLMMVSTPAQQVSTGPLGIPSGNTSRGTKPEAGIAIVAPLTGVYFSAPSPTSPPFVSVGDIVQVGQVVALVEAMKVFNEIQ